MRAPMFDAPVSPAIAGLLALVGLAAGFVDAIAGGGGLLTLPALLLAGFSPQAALATNKGQSLFGSGAALLRFSRSPLLDRKRARVSFLPAFVGAFAGVLLVTRVSPSALRPIVLVLLLGVAVTLLVRQTNGREEVPHGPPLARPAWLAALVAGLLGLYDGFFGPGCGTFLIMLYVALWHDAMDAASANAKATNFASNVASFIAFAWAGGIVWSAALPMALGQAIGGRLGAHATIASGRVLVRRVVVAVSLAFVVRLSWQLLEARLSP